MAQEMVIAPRISLIGGIISQVCLWICKVAVCIYVAIVSLWLCRACKEWTITATEVAFLNGV